MIRAVTVRRFKRLVDASCELERVTGVVGANNSGKSSFLQALHFAAACAQSGRLRSVDQWNGETFETTIHQADLLYFPSDASEGVFGSNGHDAEIDLRTADARCIVRVVAVGLGAVRITLEGRTLGEQLQSTQPPYTMYAPGLAGLARREEFVSEGVLLRSVARGDANLVLRNVLQRLLLNAAAWPLFLRSMQAIFPGIEFRARQDNRVDPHILLEFRIGESPWLPVDAAGNGILQAAQLLGYVDLFEPQLVILDEPDSHLHPDNQRRLCRLFVDLARERDIQIIFATHSRHVLDATRGEVSVVWLSGGAAVGAPQTEFTPMLLEIGALDAIDFVRSEHPRCVVATEDTDAELLKALLGANGFRMNETYVLSYSGCSQVGAARVLGEYLRARAPGVSLVVHRDRDYASDDELESFRHGLIEAGVRVFVTNGNDIEHAFLCEAHLAAVTKMDLAMVEQLVAKAIERTKDRSVKAIVDQRTQRAMKRRGAGGDNVDHGAIAVAAVHDYDESPRAMCHGKSVLAQVREALNREIGRHPSIEAKSEHLSVAELGAIASAIWAS